MTVDDLIEAKTYFEVYRELPLGMTEKLLDLASVVLMKPEEAVAEVVIAKPKRKASTQE